MEHMNFNGTRHYPKNELVDYLQKAGVRFGADINAYTGFDETVYQLPLPSDKPDVLEHGIEIMRDWAQEALLDPTEIDKERGVVLEEKRLGKGAQQRMQQQYLPVLFNHSRYSLRLPIGQDSVLNHFFPATLRRFYHNWYRPDLQALIVVGDIDVNKMEQTIKARFADLINPANELPRTPYSIPLTGGNQFIAITDKEQTSTALQVMIMHKALIVKTAADYRQHVLRSLFNSMLAARYQELQQYNPPFVAGDAGINSFQGGLDMFSAGVVAKPGALERGFKAVWREVERVK
jgi:zinc protease